MAIYIATIILSIILVPLAKKRIKIKGKKIQGQDIYLTIMIIVFTMIAGLRGNSVGSDTQPYIWTFNRIGNYQSLIDAIKAEPSSGIGYIILNRIIHLISDYSQFHVFVEASIINIGIAAFIKKTSKSYYLPVILYIGTTLMFFSMNGTKQSISIVLCANALVYLVENIKSIKGWILFIIASSIHIISVVSLPIVIGSILYSKRKGRKHLTVIIFAIAGIAVGSLTLLFSGIIARYFGHYSMYIDGRGVNILAKTGGGRIAIIYVILFAYIVLWYINKKNNQDSTQLFYDKIVPGLTFGMVFGIFNAKNELINRLIWYYVILFIAFIPFSISISDKKYKAIIFAGTILAFLAYSFLSLKENHGLIVPYQFFWQ